MIRSDADTRERERQLKAELRAIKKPAKEAARLERRADRKARKKDRPAKFDKRDFPAKPKVDDGAGYMGWLHDGLPCVACLVLGPHPHAGRIEAAHQKLQVADRGWHRRAGRRGPHWSCAPLCSGHHRLGPICCDPAQTKFWSVLGLEPEQVIDFVEALNAAYRGGAAGAPIVHQFAALAAQRRAA